MRRLTIIVIVAALAYSTFWFWNASAQRNAIEAWFEDRRQSGWAADYADLEIKGFPNRLDTTLTSPRLGDPNSGLMWESPFFQIFRLTYNPKHMIAVGANQQTFATPNGELGVETSDLRASIELAELASWTPERIIVVAEDLQLASTNGIEISADLTQLSAEQLSENTYRVALDSRALQGILPGLVDTIGTETTPIDRLTADIVLQLTNPLDRTAIETARPQPRHITLNLAEAQWNGLNIAAAGELDISDSGTPFGTISLKLRNWRELIASERQSGRFSPRALNQIELTLGVISGLSGNPETLDLPFDFSSKGVWLGPLKISDTPTIRIP